jgi:TetR/AcrR family transcriptional repressor of nem operon
MPPYFGSTMGRISNARELLMTSILELMWSQSYGSVTVDAICERAGVKKGSFYYFFKSKTDLAIEALEHKWSLTRPELEAIFSPNVPPLARILGKLDHCYRRAVEDKKIHGRVLGCPYFHLGSEVCGVEPELRDKVRQILSAYHIYFETAIRDGQDDGSINVEDAKASTRCLFNLIEGTLTQARIHNDPEVIKDLRGATLNILGAATPAAIAAV